MEDKINQEALLNSEDLRIAFTTADNIVTKKYLGNLSELSLMVPENEVTNQGIKSTCSLFKINKIVYDKNENILHKLLNTYSIATGINKNLVMIITSDGEDISVYLGTTGSKEISEARASSDILLNNFLGNFPGSEGELLDNDKLINVIDLCTSPKNKYVSCFSGVASERSDNDVDNCKYVQGFEKLLDTLSGREFTMVIIANHLDNAVMQDLRSEYELLYSQLSPFEKSTLGYNESSSEGVSKTLTNSLGTTITKNKSTALGVGSSESKSHTEGRAVTHTDTIGGSYSNSSTIGVSAGIGGVGGFAANTSTFSVNYSHSYARTKSWSDTVTTGTTKTQTDTIGESDAKSEIESIADGTSKQETTGRTLQITSTNKTVAQLLKNIDEQLERTIVGSDFGTYAIATYFLAEDATTVNMAASSYKGIMCGNNTHVEESKINNWVDSDNVKYIKQYLRALKHPEFIFDEYKNIVTPATIVNGKELSVQMGLPRKAVSGIPVIEVAPFGRNLNSSNIKSNRKINIGNLFHMGKEEGGKFNKIPVSLDMDSLTMHTFITGSTGSGKSNAIYSIIDAILDKNKDVDTEENKVSFMVVEPAKGEYKEQFGWRKDVKVYGTNFKKNLLLRINPFSFPDDVLVLEHIDKLIEIFNVCWPMYAAMPAILKEAIERAYVKAGWDLEISQCRYRDILGYDLFPNFEDINKQVNNVLNSSKYSDENKGNYIGALCTRLNSLTNGLYRQIFTTDELTNEELFDKNVIIDLSRLGSTETKALLMGLLVMKMQEYRVSKKKVSNSNLKHITVLEEAHHLLKRVSSVSSGEGSNLMGKAVEMLGNSIAEMRTYGEAFIIADQAPGLMDMAVIRNTNTKIILRLPDLTDRELVGKAAALNDDQIIELSKLQTGVAAVYQNNWLEPVLCHINRASISVKSFSYDYKDRNNSMTDMKKLVKFVLAPFKRVVDIPERELDNLKAIIHQLNCSAGLKVDLMDYILNFRNMDYPRRKRCKQKIIFEIFNSNKIIEYIRNAEVKADRWFNDAVNLLEPTVDGLTQEEINKILILINTEYFELNRTLVDKEVLLDLTHYIKTMG